MSRTWIVIGLIMVALAGSPAPAPAGVSVNLGFQIPGPPPLVPVPGVPVMYAPGAPANYFSYAGQYYVFVDGGWYASPGYDGPWVTVVPEFVPLPLLAVPIGYYRFPPTAWRGWRREGPPRWEGRWGRQWVERGAEPRAMHRSEGFHGGRR